MSKAKDFLDDNYVFAGKTTRDIMHDVVKSQYEDGFSDAELSLAFKIIKKPHRAYDAFGPHSSGADIETIFNQEY